MKRALTLIWSGIVMIVVLGFFAVIIGPYLLVWGAAVLLVVGCGLLTGGFSDHSDH